jgi:hypothetical protein
LSSDRRLTFTNRYAVFIMRTREVSPTCLGWPGTMFSVRAKGQEFPIRSSD